MGPVNWKAVIWAGIAAVTVLSLAFRGTPKGFRAGWMGQLGITLNWIPAAMLGHALARIGPEKLAAKPWLYFMQSIGLALAIVIPAIWLSHVRLEIPRRETVRESIAFFLAYFAMGAVFWAMG